ncbi:hypothetical protein SeMB42_g02424 [Synchytrium endobioticum]|uniref:Uncharacterized protein n=1 Tax=Synchytrium endobioticum TaxID=286115 RepID=A0A507DGI8_9FUNG|nr:hypothetical protein SeLEV6574_g03871 [Synchytrium endobioticum]TPX49950.1 hypothetical protein SeMB42_g02424 [Synchytrium endobioticum]
MVITPSYNYQAQQPFRMPIAIYGSANGSHATRQGTIYNNMIIGTNTTSASTVRSMGHALLSKKIAKSPESRGTKQGVHKQDTTDPQNPKRKRLTRSGAAKTIAINVRGFAEMGESRSISDHDVAVDDRAGQIEQGEGDEQQEKDIRVARYPFRHRTQPPSSDTIDYSDNKSDMAPRTLLRESLRHKRNRPDYRERETSPIASTLWHNWHVDVDEENGEADDECDNADGEDADEPSDEDFLMSKQARNPSSSPMSRTNVKIMTRTSVAASSTANRARPSEPTSTKTVMFQIDSSHDYHNSHRERGIGSHASNTSSRRRSSTKPTVTHSTSDSDEKQYTSVAFRRNQSPRSARNSRNSNRRRTTRSSQHGILITDDEQSTVGDSDEVTRVDMEDSNYEEDTDSNAKESDVPSPARYRTVSETDEEDLQPKRKRYRSYYTRASLTDVSNNQDEDVVVVQPPPRNSMQSRTDMRSRYPRRNAAVRGMGAMSIKYKDHAGMSVINKSFKEATKIDGSFSISLIANHELKHCTIRKSKLAPPPLVLTSFRNTIVTRDIEVVSPTAITRPDHQAPQRPISGRTTLNSRLSVQVEDTSDEAYIARHRKPEKEERRLAIREMEIYKHQLYHESLKKHEFR